LQADRAFCTVRLSRSGGRVKRSGVAALLALGLLTSVATSAGASEGIAVGEPHLYAPNRVATIDGWVSAADPYGCPDRGGFLTGPSECSGEETRLYEYVTPGDETTKIHIASGRGPGPVANYPGQNSYTYIQGFCTLTGRWNDYQTQFRQDITTANLFTGNVEHYPDRRWAFNYLYCWVPS
jgi:hypothetical protein